MSAVVAIQRREVAPAVFVGVQSGFGRVSDFKVFNLAADIAGHPQGSTVSDETLVKAGFALPTCSEITPDQVAAAPGKARCIEVVAHPHGGWTHAVPFGVGTNRFYRDRWARRRAAIAAIF